MDFLLNTAIGYSIFSSDKILSKSFNKRILRI